MAKIPLEPPQLYHYYINSNGQFELYMFRFFTLFLITLTGSVYADDKIKIGIGYAPVVSAKLSDPFPQIFVKGTAMAEMPANIRILPVERSILFVRDGKLDMHAPFISNPKIPHTHPNYKVSDATFYQLNFVLYSNADKPIDMDSLEKNNLVTDRAFTELMGFKVGSITNINNTMKMVNLGRLDGVIYASEVVDPIIEMYKFKNVKRTFFGTFDVKAIIANNDKQQAIEAMITNTAKAMKGSEEFKILASEHRPYEDWQPYKRYR